MMGGKKPSLAVLFGGGSKESPSEDAPNDKGHAAAGRVLSAIKKSDAAALDDALADHYAACMGEDEDEDEEGDAAEED